MVDLRTYIFIDQLQLQMASYIAMVSRGYFPVAEQACCVIEISPGIEINRLTDIAVKATDVKPGLQIVERLLGCSRCTLTIRVMQDRRERPCSEHLTCRRR
jgi:hypothetical protein